jgi:hypothetical protein
MLNESSRLCLCGCGQVPAPDRRGRPRAYCPGHHPRDLRHDTSSLLCLCGCGQSLTFRPARVASGRTKFASAECRVRYQRSPERQAELFWPKVDKDSPPSSFRPDLGPCWLWTGNAPSGYGQFHYTDADGGNHSIVAHKWAYQRLVGPVPQGLELDHLCRVRRCCNPAHLEAVTSAVNKRRATELIETCPNGHPYDEANTRWSHGKWRQCRACGRERARLKAADRAD